MFIGMIFIFSVGGVSYVLDEWFYWLDVEKGCNVLLNSFLIIQYDNVEGKVQRFYLDVYKVVSLLFFNLVYLFVVGLVQVDFV